MNIISKYLDLGDFTSMLLQVRDKLSWSDFPNSDLSFLSSRDYEFVIVRQSYGSNSIFVCIIYLPKWLIIINSECSYSAVRPSWKDDFICEKRAHRVNSGSVLSLVNASSFDGIIVGVPKSNGAINWRCNKFVRYSCHIVNMNDWLGMVFSKKHLREITDSYSIKETLRSGSKSLNSILTWAKALDASIKLGLHQWLTEILVDMEQNNLSITTTHTNFVVGDSLNIFDSLSTYRLSKNKHFVLNLERAEISRSGTSKQEFLIWFGESKACIISDHGTCSNQLIRAMSFIWIKRPKSQLFRSSDSKLIIRCIS